jgi:glycine betaine/proline transport system substrate-binding protein
MPIAHKGSVKIPLLDWSSQRVISRAIGEELTNNGFNVEYLSMSEEVLWGTLARGKAHFQIEIWQASANNEFQDMLNKNRIEDIGLHSAVTIEDWWYPDYVEELCPGLPDWRALNKCAALFSDGDSTKGNYLTGPWPYRDGDLIRSLSLDFKIKRYQDMKQVWQVLEEAKAEKRPIVLLNWTPNWSDDRLSGKFVKFPAYSPECETDPSWGVNPKLAFDCANVPNGWIKKAAWVGLKNKLPCVYQFVSNIDLNNEMIAEAAALVDYDKLTEQEAVSLWRKKYHQQMNTWGSNSCI